MADQEHEFVVPTVDGGIIPARSVGRGPAVVVVHGGGVRAGDYRRLADALAPRCRVITYDRRPAAGRDSPDPAVVFDDLQSVLIATGARRLFGHSIGGFLALEAARRMPVDAVAVYDPAVWVDDLFPVDFFEPFARAVEAGDAPRAMAIVNRGLHSSGPASDLPLPLQLAGARLFLSTSIGRRIREGLPEVVEEDRIGIEAAGPASRYADVTARLLLAYGGRSPAYYGPICERLAAAVPGARSVRIPRGSHNAPNVARPSFTEAIADFLSAA